MAASVVQHPSSVDRLRLSAVRLAEMGYRVFRLAQGSKRPLPGVSWPDEATSDPEAVRRMWDAPWNIGIACGSGLLVMDGDSKGGKDGPQQVRSMLEIARITDYAEVETPSGGIHVYLRVPDGAPPLANSVGKVAKGVDIRAEGGYVVGPGSILVDGTRYKWPTPLGMDDLPEATTPLLEHLTRRAERPTPDQLYVDQVEIDSPVNIERAVAALAHIEPAVEGRGGDHHTYATACRVKDFGISETECLRLLLTHFNPRCVPQWSPAELERKVRNAYQYGTNPPGSASAQAVFQPIDDMLPEANPVLRPVGRLTSKSLHVRRWQVEGFSMHGQVSLLVAAPGVGKTTMTLAMALSLASGNGDIIGKTVHAPGRVAILNGEDGEDELRLRLAALAQHHGLDESVVDDVFFVDPRAFRLLARTESGLLRPHGVQRLIAALKEANVTTLILDPLVELHDANENDNGEMSKVGAVMRAVAQAAECSVIAVHHSRKNGVDSDGHAGNLDSARGASALAGVARFMFTLWGMDKASASQYGVPADQRHMYVRLDGAKANMTLIDGDAKWWKRHEVQVECEDGTEPVGVLLPWTLTKVETTRGRGVQAMVEAVKGVVGDDKESDETRVALALQSAGGSAPLEDVVKVLLATTGRTRTTAQRRLQGALNITIDKNARPATVRLNETFAPVTDTGSSKHVTD